MTLLAMTDLDLQNKRVLIREDFNVPMQGNEITDDSRIRRALPTIQAAIQAKAKIMLMSHLGDPETAAFDPTLSLAPVARRLSELLGKPIPVIRDWPQNKIDVNEGQVVLFENVRFLPGEKDNDPTLAKQMASLCDIFVMDAFATAHRKHASVLGVSELAPIACAGPLLLEEVQHINKALEHPEAPVIAIVGGSKVSTKIQLLNHLLDKVDVLIVGGGIANTLLAAKGLALGQSLYEPNWIATARDLLNTAEKKGVKIPLPTDALTADDIKATEAVQRSIQKIQATDKIFDIGPETLAEYIQAISTAKTIIWNGPVGVFENPVFAKGTQQLAMAITQSTAYSIAGGGDTLAALAQFHIQGIAYISTGGGAFLSMMQGEPLPVLAILEKRAKQYV